jgi:hypothetical protein
MIKLSKEMEQSAFVDAMNANFQEINANLPKKLVIDKDSADWKTDTSSDYEIDVPIDGVTEDDIFTEIVTTTSYTLTAGNGFVTVNTGSGTAPQSDVTIVVVKTTSIL